MGAAVWAPLKGRCPFSAHRFGDGTKGRRGHTPPLGRLTVGRLPFDKMTCIHILVDSYRAIGSFSDRQNNVSPSLLALS